VPAYTLTPRFILSTRELHAHSIQIGHSCRVDSGFGQSGRSGATTMAFGDSIANMELEEVEEVPLVEINTAQARGPA